MTDDDNPFARWSRRKRAAAAGAAAPAPEQPVPKPPVAKHDDQVPEEEILKKLGLPDPDSLTSGDDFKAFLAREVPEYLRQRALRRLWSSNPVLANVDGLVDYGGDFTDAALVPEVLQTAYRVGKGFLRDAVEPTDPAAEDADPQPDPAIAEAPEEENDALEPAQATGPATADFGQMPADLADENAAEPPRPRRMTFRTT